MNWLSEHPEIVIGLVTALLTLLLRPRSTEEEDLFQMRSPRLFALRELLRAVGFDSPKAAAELYRLATGKPRGGKDEPPKT